MVLPPPSTLSPPSTLDLPLPDPEAYEGEPQEYARALMQRRDEIERQVETLNQVLNSHGVNAGTSLLDPEGYPRADIDVWTIRHTRSALARLRTDHRQISDLLVPALEAAFARTSLSSSSTSTAGAGTSARTGVHTGTGSDTTQGAPSRLDASGRPIMNGHSRSSTSSTAYSAPSSEPHSSPFPSPSTGGTATSDTERSPGSTRPQRSAYRFTTTHSDAPLRLRGPAERVGQEWTSEDEREYAGRARAEAEARGEVWDGEGDERDDHTDEVEEHAGDVGRGAVPGRRDEGIRGMAVGMDGVASGTTTPRPEAPVPASAAGGGDGGRAGEGEGEDGDVWPEGVLARVNTVAPNSPAEQAGLLPDDLIRTFGDIDAPSGRGLTAIGALVIRSEGIAIPLRVERNGQRVRLGLTPRNGWGGRGLLGCHILPP